MENERFNPDASCGFRKTESYFEDNVICNIFGNAWKRFTLIAPEFLDIKRSLLHLLYPNDLNIMKKNLILVGLQQQSSNGISSIMDQDVYVFLRDLREKGRKLDFSKIPKTKIKKLLCSNPSLISHPVITLAYMMAVENARLGNPSLLSLFSLSKKEMREKKIPDSLILVLYWAIEGILESIDRIINSPDREELTNHIVRPHLTEELFFKLLISHPPLKKIALQQTWILLQNEGFDVASNYVAKIVNSNLLRKQHFSKDEYRKIHMTLKQENSFEQIKQTLDQHEHLSSI